MDPCAGHAHKCAQLFLSRIRSSCSPLIVWEHSCWGASTVLTTSILKPHFFDHSKCPLDSLMYLNVTDTPSPGAMNNSLFPQEVAGRPVLSFLSLIDFYHCSPFPLLSVASTETKSLSHVVTTNTYLEILNFPPLQIIKIPTDITPINYFPWGISPEERRNVKKNQLALICVVVRVAHQILRQNLSFWKAFSCSLLNECSPSYHWHSSSHWNGIAEIWLGIFFVCVCRASLLRWQEDLTRKLVVLRWESCKDLW